MNKITKRWLLAIAGTLMLGLSSHAPARGHHWVQCPDGSWVHKWDYDKLCTVPIGDDTGGTDTGGTDSGGTTGGDTGGSTGGTTGGDTGGTTSSGTYTYVHQPVGSNGLAPNSFTFCNRKWTNRNAQNWNTKVPDAVKFDFNNCGLLFVLHDTSNDHGANDADYKRRSEIGTNAAWKNDVVYWREYSFKATINAPNGLSGLGEALQQTQDPNGSSPSIADRLKACNNSSAMCIDTTTRTTGSTTSRGMSGPLAQGQVHHVVQTFRLGNNGFVKTYIDGVKTADYTGAIGVAGSTVTYGQRHGIYGAPLNGMTITIEYRHMSKEGNTTDLSSRISNAPAW